MYKKLLAVSAAAIVLSACSSSEPEQETNPELKVQCETAQGLVGGWQKAEITPEAKQSASLAIASMEGNHTLKEILSVEQQVVAGMNYKVTFTVDDGTAYVTKVFRNLQGEYKIVSLQPKQLVNECVEQQTERAQEK
ncbi:MAG TPA: cystatin [Vibrio sp.]|uniref:cystatin domain-containing protein n=1 Tax=Vibrio TaxID=662 RepID=UPI0004291D61|nr:MULTISPECIES: cystatin domain-containing protein [Vibrio]HCH00323.1 cystatin [Vibrio sp.]